MFDSADNGTLHQATFTVVGYGARMEFTTDPDAFLAGLPPIQFFFDDLTRKFSPVDYNSHSGGIAFFGLHVDAADATEDQAAGLGDSGGPLLLTQPDGSETLTATVIGPAGPRFFRTQRIDIPEVRGFLETAISSVEGD